MPVATTETRIMPSSVGSCVAPRMMLASGSTSSRMRVAASSSSYSIMSGPPVIEISRPRAPFIETSSSSGLAIAASAARMARRSPEASPVPIIALPISRITARTSAKSRLISPGLTIRSVIRGDARIEHLVGHGEGVGEGCLVVGDPEQVLVRDDDERVDALLQFGDAGLGDAHAAQALEMERLGDDADRQDADLAGDPGDDGRGAGAGSAAHAGGDEHHVDALEMVANLVDDLLRRGAPDLGLRAGAEALGDLHAHLDDALGLGQGQRLRVGVGDDEVDALQAGLDHVVDGIAARAAHTEHGDARLELADVGQGEVDRHGVPLYAKARRRAPSVGTQRGLSTPNCPSAHQHRIDADLRSGRPQKLSFSQRPMRTM